MRAGSPVACSMIDACPGVPASRRPGVPYSRVPHVLRVPHIPRAPHVPRARTPGLWRDHGGLPVGSYTSSPRDLTVAARIIRIFPIKLTAWRLDPLATVIASDTYARIGSADATVGRRHSGRWVTNRARSPTVGDGLPGVSRTALDFGRLSSSRGPVGDRTLKTWRAGPSSASW